MLLYVCLRMVSFKFGLPILSFYVIGSFILSERLPQKSANKALEGQTEEVPKTLEDIYSINFQSRISKREG